MIDPLTGIANRRAFLHEAGVMAKRHGANPRPTAVLLIDLDHFKSINDRFGHAAGDAALRAVTDVVRGGLRTVDLLGRYGGEELMVALPETGRAEASIALDRIRSQISLIRLTPPEATVRVSGGIVEMNHGESLEAGLKRADAALYEAKRTGRNRLIVA
jgi:diguanylate cyclase (GGDEF)-like protein